MRSKLNVKIEVETMFEGKPIELEFIRQAIQEKRDRVINEVGEGCPANNTNCTYLKNNICIHVMADVRNDSEKISCGSFKL